MAAGRVYLRGGPGIIRLDRGAVVRVAPLGASVALHIALGIATVVAPLASARVRDVIAVELVAVEPPPRVADAPPPPPPAPAKRLALPRPIAMPPPKLETRSEPPAREPEPDPAPAAPPVAPASFPSAASVSQPVSPAPSPMRAREPGEDVLRGVGAGLDPSATRARAPGQPSVESRPTTATSPVIASIPRDTGITRVARPTGGYQVRPPYPSSARRLGVQGTTLLRVHVLADGRIGKVDVEQSAGHPDLDQAAADAVRRWRFEPARRGEESVAMWVRLPVEFHLK